MTDSIGLLRAPEAEQYTNYPARALKAAARKGKLPSYQIGKFVMFRRSDLDAFVESCRVAAD